VESYRFPRIGGVTISIGYAGINGNEHITQVIDRADKALYFAKENGRNAVFSYEALLKKGLLSQREVKDSIELF
jgi:predicted signal transduction protein with EAL and GGDEF domain